MPNKAGEGGGQPFRNLSLLFMSLFQGGGRAIMDNVTKILQFFLKSFLMYLYRNSLGHPLFAHVL